MSRNLIVVRAEWDNEAKVWVATSDDVGLVTEAASLELLRDKIPLMVRDLLDGESLSSDIPIEIIAHAHTRVRAGVAA